MKKTTCLLIACSLMTSCIVVRGRDGTPGKPGTSGVSSNSCNQSSTKNKAGCL